MHTNCPHDEVEREAHPAKVLTNTDLYPLSRFLHTPMGRQMGVHLTLSVRNGAVLITEA